MLVLWGVLLPPNNHGFTGKWVENPQYESFLSFSLPLNHDYGRRSTNFWMHHYIPGTQMGPLVFAWSLGLVLRGLPSQLEVIWVRIRITGWPLVGNDGMKLLHVKIIW